MDNLCHTLAGLALGEAGLKRRTPLGNAALMIGANLPDLDALAYAWGPVTALGFRRGWTHGILAMGVWPLVLAGLVLAWDRTVRRRRHPQAEPVRPPGVLLVAAVAVWSHPLLDLLNTYGVRLLMPFSGRWFYGDTLFIIDVWVWLALVVGATWSRLRWSTGDENAGRPARVAIALSAGYIGLMAASSAHLRGFVTRAMGAHEPRPLAVMVAPLPLTPFKRQVVVELPDVYALGTLRLTPAPRFAGHWVQVPKHDRLPEAVEAARTDVGATYLRWARFPFFAFGEDCTPGLICLRDARYFPQDWAEVAVPVGGAISSAPSPSSRTMP